MRKVIDDDYPDFEIAEFNKKKYAYNRFDYIKGGTLYSKEIRDAAMNGENEEDE